ncbi:MAG TPA: bifunctional riboflavin kinase/FAD synthetase [Bacteroidales bacterium]|nr:bifunctional riboflavin kinase/FAD synthetase [Bacteroidales bacterium]HPT01632.1 bifunctional riboflavin kinase/FAD synthetase [Bacteroidales bacterium]
MRIYHSISEFASATKPVATVGVFDGVHRGHMEIINHLVASAKRLQTESVIVTFEPHPRLVLDTYQQVKLLQTLDEKLERFELAGVDAAVIIPFDKSFAGTDPQQFIRFVLIDSLHVQKIITGHDHMFGRNREGDYALLVEIGAASGVEIEQVKAVSYCGEEVSSTSIRKALAAGNVKLAGCMLGYPYSFSGKVYRGNQIGKLIHFPTANIEPDSPYKIIPANGVYASLVEWNGKRFKGMSNIGTRPTINANHLTIEVNIFDFDTEIYFEKISLSFIERIRDERKFGGLEQLQHQLSLDKEVAMQLLEETF